MAAAKWGQLSARNSFTAPFVTVPMDSNRRAVIALASICIGPMHSSLEQGFRPGSLVLWVPRLHSMWTDGLLLSLYLSMIFQ